MLACSTATVQAANRCLPPAPSALHTNLNTCTQVKVLVDADSGRVVGLHMVEPSAPEIMQVRVIRGGSGIILNNAV